MDEFAVQVRLAEDEIPSDIDRIKRQIEAGLSPDRRHSTNETKERAHQNRLEAIQRQSAAAIQQIETRKQAQLDIIRERVVQREIEQQRRLERAAQTGSGSFQAFLRRFSSTIREAGESIQQAGFAALGLTGLLVGLARTAVQSAIDIDKQVNVLKALTGSAEAAEKRFAELVATAQKTPGLTASLAATLDAQLRVASVTEQTINKILPAIGKLNAISPLEDPQRFSQNLVQLVTQNFERTDLKELVGQSPLAGEIIKQIFNVDSAINSKAIREAAQKLGLTTTDAFFTAFAEAAANNPKLANVTESLGTQLQKLQDRLAVAIRPLGLALLEVIVPAVERTVPVIEQLFSAFSKLPQGLQVAIIAFGALAAAVGPVVIALGGLIQLTGAIGNLSMALTALSATSTAAAAATGTLSISFTPLLVALGAVAVVAGLAVGAYKLYTLAAANNTEAILDNTVAANRQIEASQAQVTELEKLVGKNKLNKTDQEQIKRLYDQLNPVQQERVKLYAEEAGGVETLSGKLVGLIQLMEQENALRQQRARSQALDAGGRVVEQALLNDINQSVVANNVAKLSAEFDRLTKAIARAENENQSFVGGIGGRRFRTADFLQNQLKEVDAALKGAIDRQRQVQAQTQSSANAIRALAQSAQLSPETFIAQFVDGDVDKLDRVLNTVKGTLPFIPEPSSPGKPKPGPTGGGASDVGESTQRALREATLRAEQDARRNEFKLLQDQNERILKENEHFFRIGLIQADQFFNDKLGLQQASIGNEINLLKQQQAAAQEAFDNTKPNTVERVRLLQQLNDFQTQIIIKTRELGDVEKHVFRESLAAKNQAIEAAKQQLQVAEEQSKVEKEILATQREGAKTQEAQLRLARKALTDRGKDLDRAILETGANLDLKILNAQKEATLENRKADEEAILSMVKNRERLADATIFHAERAQAIFLDHLARQQSVTGAVASAQIKAFEGVAGSLDKGIDRLTKKLGFFGDTINGIIKSIARNILANLFAPTFGGGRQGGGFLGSILGGIFGPQAGGGLLSNIFRTPSTFPATLTQAFAGATGGGITAPPSLSNINSFFGASVPRLAGSVAASSGSAIDQFFGPGVPRTAGNVGFSFGALGKSLGPLAPLLGLSLGVGVGGQSRTGQILGGIGGTLGGLVAGTALAGGTLGSLGSTFALSGAFGPAALIAAPLLLAGGFLLGKAKQRRQDEEASGQMLTQALNAINELKAGVASDQIDGSQAKAIFENQILQQFIQQINTLKTESVRTSRLTNQVRDLRNIFETSITPEIAAQEKRRTNAARFAAIDARLIPQFASGGIVPGFDRGFDSVNALLRPGEMVLTLGQQAHIAQQAGADVFNRAGVPGVQPQATFQHGGVAPNFAQSSGRSDAPIVIFLDAVVDAEGIFIRGGSTESGRQVIVKQIDATALSKGRPSPF